MMCSARMRACIVFLVALSSPLLHAAESGETLPPNLGNWQRKAFEQIRAVELATVAGEEAPLLLEYGSQRAERAHYRRGNEAWYVVLHSMVDRSSAYGAFTSLRVGGAPMLLGEAGALVADRVVFYQGKYFVVADSQASRPALVALANQLEAEAGHQPPLPNLPVYLPQSGQVRGSDRYLLGPLALARAVSVGRGDWAGFAYGAEAESSRYRISGTEATLVLLSYPTPQIAAERVSDFQQNFNFNGTGNSDRPLVFGRREGTMFALTFGFQTEAAATTLLDQVRYERELSWSRLGEPQTEAEWAGTLVNLFVGTGLFVLFGLILGLSFAGFRALVRRLWPGKVFDRKETSEIIRLNLGRNR